MPSQIQFCKSADGTRLAIFVMGRREGGIPLVAHMGVGTSVEDPYWEPFISALCKHRRVIAFDRRGSGASDRDVEQLGIESEIEDIAAMVEHLSLGSFDLWATQEGCGIAIRYTVENPDRVRRLALFGGFPSGPRIARAGAVEGFTGLVRSNWRMARRAIADMLYPSGPQEDKDAIADGLKRSISPEMAAKSFELFWQVDATDYLEKVQAPTLVLHRRGDAMVPLSAGRELAALIPGAQLVVLNGDVSAAGYDSEQYMDILDEFLGVSIDRTVSSGATSAFRAVLFTDLVGHTEMMSRLGDDRGRAVLREHESVTREVLNANGGTEVKTMGDGFMASFTSVTKSVECAIALQQAFAKRDGEPLAVRVGINAGEPIEEDGDLFGATVILASRIAAKAEGGEILVADTVRGLCSGKGFAFADRGEFVAKGMEEPVRVYEVSWQAS